MKLSILNRIIEQLRLTCDLLGIESEELAEATIRTIENPAMTMVQFPLGDAPIQFRFNHEGILISVSRGEEYLMNL